MVFSPQNSLLSHYDLSDPGSSTMGLRLARGFRNKGNRDHKHELKISYLLQVPTNNLPRHPLSEKTFLKT